MLLNDIIEISCHAFERYYRDIMSCFSADKSHINLNQLYTTYMFCV